MNKLIYENLAIGVIAQRIGECRFANKYFINLHMAITQQTIGKMNLEEKYRDALLSVDDKILIIEFKAPIVKRTQDDNIVLEYENINLSKLKTIADKIGENNVMLALIHALLPSNYINVKYSNGFYLWLATPGTTAFIPVNELFNYLRNLYLHQEEIRDTMKGKAITIKAICQQSCVDVRYVNTLIPTCAKQTILTKQEPHCASCGGLYAGLNQLRRPVIEILYKHNNFYVLAYTLASLIKSIIDCNIGCRVSEEMVKSFPALIDLITSPTMVLMIFHQGVLSFIQPYFTTQSHFG